MEITTATAKKNSSGTGDRRSGKIRFRIRNSGDNAVVRKKATVQSTASGQKSVLNFCGGERKKLKMTLYSTSSSATNEDRVGAASEYLEEEMHDIPCDTLLAIRSIMQRGAHGIIQCSRLCVPFVLRPMVHAVMQGNDHQELGASTVVWTELEKLRRENMIRFLRLNIGGPGANGEEDEEALLETSWYEAAAREVINFSSEEELRLLASSVCGKSDRTLNGRLQECKERLLQQFLHVVQRIPRVSASEEEIVELFHATEPANSYADGGYEQRYDQKRSKTGGDDKPNEYKKEVLLNPEKAIDALISLGLLRPRREGQFAGAASLVLSPSATTYWFSLPGTGDASKSIANGRREILLKLKRAAYKECPRAKLEGTAMRTSAMPPAFHVRDLLSTGRIYLTESPAGEFVRLPGSSHGV